ncbi:MAG: radical SAM protein [Candidatus Syntrophoarchaeum sp.]|nr:radical SAM protein [Candidatus Syntrophoarchaeum sp.]
MIERLFDNDTVGTGCFSYLPAEFVWAVTKRCNLSCLHCSIEESDEGELTLDEGKLLIEDAAALGDVKFALTGGEPLLRKDIYELISYASGFDMQIVMATNATLITREVAEKLVDAGLERFGVSIDGVGDAHDKIRGVKGAFERTMKGLEAAKDAGLSFQFHSMVTAYNLDEIPKIIDLAEELGAYRIYFVYLIPMGKAREIPEACIGVEENKKFFEYIYERQHSSSVWLKPICNPQYWLYLKSKEDGDFRMTGCTAGITRFHIFPNGDVAPCAYLPVKAGSLKEKRFGEILETSEVFRNLRERKLNGNCGVCIHREECGGCRSRAYGFSGDYLGEDPVCGWWEEG